MTDFAKNSNTSPELLNGAVNMFFPTKISEFVMYISQRLIAHEGKEKHMLKIVKLDNKFRASTTAILKKFHSEHRVLSYFRYL